MKRTVYIVKFCVGLAAAFLLGVIACIGVTLAPASSAWAYPGEMPPEQQAPLPEGTVITAQNWQQYKDYMRSTRVALRGNGPREQGWRYSSCFCLPVAI
jgi:hypothetical protein